MNDSATKNKEEGVKSPARIAHKHTHTAELGGEERPRIEKCSEWTAHGRIESNSKTWNMKGPLMIFPLHLPVSVASLIFRVERHF